MYETFEHTADAGLRIQAETLEELLVDAAHGLFSLIIANPEAVQAVEEKFIRIEREGDDYLLFDWLNELLYSFDVEGLLVCQLDIHLSPQELTATCRGETIDPSRHEMATEVKAITYHGLKVEQQDGHWIGEVIVDI